MNEHRTVTNSDTDLAPACSPDVRSAALVNRRRVGAYSPAGQRWSNLDEMLRNRETATGDALANLNFQIEGQAAGLARLSLPKG